MTSVLAERYERGGGEAVEGDFAGQKVCYSMKNSLNFQSQKRL